MNKAWNRRRRNVRDDAAKRAQRREFSHLSPAQCLDRVFIAGNRTLPRFRSTSSGKEIARAIREWRMRSGPSIFVCRDGAFLSVIAGPGTYSTPGGFDDLVYSGPYSGVEVWRQEEDSPHGPVSRESVNQYLHLHGGLVAAGWPEDY